MTDNIDYEYNLITEYRDINVETGWHRDIYREFEDAMQNVGVEVHAMHFSGFCSQGDGACFSGHVTDWKEFMKVHFTPEQLEPLKTVMQDGYMDITIGLSSSRYSHSHTMRIDVEWYVDGLGEELENASEPKRTMLEALMNHCEKGINTLEPAIIRILRGYADDMYSKLYDLYEELTSDEAVWDTIVANELNILYTHGEI